MNDKPESPVSGSDPNPEPPSSNGGRPDETDRQGEGWFDRLRAAVGLKSLSFRRELQEALEDDSEDETFSSEERTLINNILRLRETRVEDIMIPRADVDAIDIDQTLGDLFVRFHRSGHTRLPVYRESLDEPVGMVHIKDLLHYVAERGGAGESNEGDPARIDLSKLNLTPTIAEAKLVRDVLFVPPSMPVTNLLTLMQNSRTQMALVIDEYGGTDGVVSIEDTVETIVGEIEDEHSEDEPEIVSEGAGIFVADARAELVDLDEAIGGNLAADDEVDTIGGLVFRRLGRIPETGETVTLPEGYNVEVLDSDRRRIRKLRISPTPASEDNPAVETMQRTASGA